MSVLIKGMEMPKEGFVEVLIRDDGTVQQTGQSYRIDGTDYYTPYVGEMPVMYKAVPVPPHGRLIDADDIEKRIKMWLDHPDEYIRERNRDMLYYIQQEDPVIEAGDGG